MHIKHAILGFFLVVAILLPSVILAAEEKPDESNRAAVSDFVTHDEASARLILGNNIPTAEGVNLLFGLEITLLDDWKTYWRVPGDGGLPLEVDWSGSENLTDFTLSWPAPTRFVAYDNIENYGYKHDVVFPVTAKIIDPGLPAKLQARVKYAVCKELCLFFDDTLSTSIPVESFTESAHLEKINSFIKRIPATNGSRGFSIDQWKIVAEKDNEGMLEVVAKASETFIEPDIFVESSPSIRFPRPSISYSDNRSTATFRIPYGILVDGMTLENQPMTLTLVDNDYAVQTQGNSGAVMMENPLMVILFFAFIGGLILNAMPCVLPVLSIKLLGIIQHGGGRYSRVRLSFLSSAAGIILSFLALAGLVIGIQSSGTAVGWGFHFQEPLFVITMVLILTLFAANMWGLFEIRTPQFVNKLVPSYDDHTLAGHFFTGVLATLLATPCTAPFLGTAIGFAFTQGTGVILLTFACMGLGLALPYLIVAAFPHAVSRLPKPGQWMNWLKYLLGMFLIITALWLIWVLNSELGMMSALALLLLSNVILLTLWLHHDKCRCIYLYSVLLLLVGLCYMLPLKVAEMHLPKIAPEEVWVPFNEQEIPKLVASGKTVFVDVTADWCLTCKANKLLVLNTREILHELQKDNIVAMKADWTKPRQDITDYLARHERRGIPFNIVYGPGAADGIILSELLTSSAVKEALAKASKND